MIAPAAWFALAVFVLTLVFVIWQPKGLSIGWSAIGGAVLALLLHVVHVADVWSVTKIVWDATLAFVGIIMNSIILDKIGFFEWAALKMAHVAKGDGRKVFLYVITLGAIVSAFFANDGAALILTPIVLEKVKLLKFDMRKMLPFILASGFIADTTSLPFIVSNLVNIVSADYFGVGFISYAVHMIVPDLFAFVASFLMLYLFFRKDIPNAYRPSDLPEAASAIRHKGMFLASWIILAVLLVGYVLTELFHIPVSFVTLAVALVFLIAGARTKTVAPWSTIRSAPWSIVVFSIGMYVVVYGLRNAGLTTLLGRLMQWSTHGGLYAGTLFTGFVAAILSSIMNNLPTVMVGALAIHSAAVTGLMREAMVYANVIGCDLGPKITPIGSLATLLWLHVLAQKGVRIGWGQYFKTGIVLTLPTLFITLSGLYVWLLAVH
ncbi:Arsenical pump membrane protein [Alicyclobacillus hesperidum URH17-3-68]|uniref:Arsenical pump membrane protein n=1 Tax=Alicyclobacillus hesperidum TaxID=89784 RepID=A0A1H2QCR5_9BACL|nr:arsenic transporter [Alicyclobacillus hesperidum]EJY54686.1 Arsenical pump membrane protein [Alicyclobacillus hesperidum URH17-3-68]GLV12698.1 putative arsenical pump membrane protein YdfA [Alicyclobacillus hesperidum]SDW04922.1 arsenical pump membrane protein [Alicyclobacillus hesperidum]